MAQSGQLSQDVRYAVRQLRRSPGFTAVAIITLALCIGANVAIFSIVNAVLLRGLPFPHADRLVQIWENDRRQGQTQSVVSPYNFVDWRSQSKSFAEMAVYEYESLALITAQAPQRMPAVLASSRFFDVFGIRALLGRTFTAEDDQPGSHSVVLSYGAWQRRFSADPNIAGKPITLDGEPYVVIGVMPSTFEFPNPRIELWSTPAFDLQTRSRGSHYLFAAGRLRAGIPLGQAQSEISTIANRLEQQYPGTNRGSGVVLVSLQEQMTSGFRTALLLLWGAVSAVLFIGCANVAHLLLARSLARQREFAIRAALGAGRGRLIRQLLTESVILAGAAGLLGLAVSKAGIYLVAASGSRVIPRVRAIEIDWHVLLFTGLIALATGIVFGLAPAFRASRLDLAGSFRQSGSDLATSGAYRLRSVLVISELALSTVLLAGSGLLIKSLWLLERVNPGFSADNVLGVRISVPESKYPDPVGRAALYQSLVDRIETLPGVERAAAINDLPFSGSRTTSSFDIAGRPPVSGEVRQADRRTVSAGYFRVMRIPLLKGRAFEDADNRRATPAVVIINQALADRYWPGANPIGQRLLLYDAPREIVGVVGNVKHDNLAGSTAPELYIPQSQGNPPPWAFLAIRNRTAALTSLVPAVRQAVREVAPDEPLYDTQTMEERLSASIAPQRFNTLALAIFAGCALLLAAIGIYGVIAFSVARRTHEIGVRMALGARQGDVLGMVIRQGLGLAVAGVALGIAASLVATRLLTGLLYGTRPADPAAFVAAPAVLIAAVALASFLPARRAARVDPMVALRYD